MPEILDLWKHHSRKIVALGSVLALGIAYALDHNPIDIFTLVLAISTIGLWFETREAGKVSKTALLEGRRARLVPGVINHELRPDPTDHTKPQYRFTFSWFNAGETPAKNMTAYIHCDIRTQRMPDDYEFRFDPSDGIRFVVGPKMVGMHVPFPPDGISADDMMENFQGTKFMYLWGWARYEDIFEGTPTHVTKFCYQIVCNGNPVNPGDQGVGVDFNYVAFPKHNCVDEECDRI